MTQAAVTLEFGAPDEQQREVEAILRAAGIEADVQANLMRFHQDPLPWVLIIRIALAGFLTAYGGGAGLGAWQGTKRLVRELCAARRRSGAQEGVIRLETEEHIFFLTDAQPDEAFHRLTEVSAWLQVGTSGTTTPENGVGAARRSGKRVSCAQTPGSLGSTGRGSVSAHARSVRIARPGATSSAANRLPLDARGNADIPARKQPGRLRRNRTR